jgi:general secretion pathway protein G
MRAQRGFTLVEILIVVVILGILAAIVIPQFTQASTEAKENSLKSDLQSLRSQIELYKCQHNDMPPGNTCDSSGTVTEDVTKFEAQMVYVSDPNGTAGTSKTRTAQFKLGPYLERVPANPFNLQNTVALASGSGVGWVYEPNTGEIHAAADSTPQSSDHILY